jgi:hypothetical protein
MISRVFALRNSSISCVEKEMRNTGMLLSRTLPVETLMQDEHNDVWRPTERAYIDLANVKDLAFTDQTLLVVLFHRGPENVEYLLKSWRMG